MVKTKRNKIEDNLKKSTAKDAIENFPKKLENEFEDILNASNVDSEQDNEDREYKRPEGTRELSLDLQNRLDRIMSAPLLVAVMTARPRKIVVGQSSVDVLVTGLLMGSHGFYGIDSGFPNKYQVVIDESIIVKEVQYIDALTVKLTISTEHAKPGLYDISFANSLGETLTGLRVLEVSEIITDNK